VPRHGATGWRSQVAFDDVIPDDSAPHRLTQPFHRFHDLLGPPRLHAKVSRQIHPADNVGRIQEELSWSSDVLSIDSGAGMQQVITANDLRFELERKVYV
jgi:hypothetical protein